MTIDARLYDLLRSDGPLRDLVGDRIYPDEASQTAGLPYIEHEQANRQSVMTHDGPVDLDSYEWSLAVYGVSRRQCKAVLKAVRDAINGHADASTRTGVRVLGIFDSDESSGADAPLFGEESGRHQMTASYSLWFKGEG
jgi:hypothetical protein